MALSLNQFQALFPKASPALLAPLNFTLARYSIDSTVRMCAFLAQVGVESNYLTVFEENLNYGAQGLLNTWPTHFTPALAATVQRQPEKIANIAYANRMGNGDPESGDGWKYRGRGLIQTTGKANYTVAGVRLGMDLVNDPDLLALPEGACYSAGDFWSAHNLNTLADIGHFDQITSEINGGQNGAAQRNALWEKAKALFNE